MKYREINECLNQLNKSPKEKIIGFIVALLISIFIISAPAAILINLAIYRNYVSLLLILGVCLLMFAFFMIQTIYYKIISDGKIKGVWIVALGDTIIPSILILGILLLVLYLEVI